MSSSNWGEGVLGNRTLKPVRMIGDKIRNHITPYHSHSKPKVKHVRRAVRALGAGETGRLETYTEVGKARRVYVEFTVVD